MMLTPTDHEQRSLPVRIGGATQKLTLVPMNCELSSFPEGKGGATQEFALNIECCEPSSLPDGFVRGTRNLAPGLPVVGQAGSESPARSGGEVPLLAPGPHGPGSRSARRCRFEGVHTCVFLRLVGFDSRDGPSLPPGRADRVWTRPV
jgi:hypothetical protein